MSVRTPRRFLGLGTSWSSRDTHGGELVAKPDRDTGHIREEAVRDSHQQWDQAEAEPPLTSDAHQASEDMPAAREHAGERPGKLTAAEFELLALGGDPGGVLGGPIELWSGRVMLAGQERVFSPAQVRAAAALGIRLRSCLDARLEDREALAEARAAL